MSHVQLDGDKALITPHARIGNSIATESTWSAHSRIAVKEK
jgi:hypothetical protein